MHWLLSTLLLDLTLTIIYHLAVLCGGDERLVTQVRLVSIVTNADLELYQVLKVVHHGTGKEDDAQSILLAVLVLLKQQPTTSPVRKPRDEQGYRDRQGGEHEVPTFLQKLPLLLFRVT